MAKAKKNAAWFTETPRNVLCIPTTAPLIRRSTKHSGVSWFSPLAADQNRRRVNTQSRSCRYTAVTLVKVVHGVASGVVGLFQARVVRRLCTSSTYLARRRLTPDFIFYIFLAEALLASAMIYACTTFGSVCVFFHGVFLHSRVTGACPVTTDLIMRVNVTTTTTETTATATATATTATALGLHIG